MNRDDKPFLTRVITISIIVTLIIQAGLYTLGYFSYSADESGRTLLAYYWLTGNMPENEPWLPFYTVAVGLLLNIFFDLFWVPRILNILFGIITSASIIFYSHKIIPDKKVTILSAVFSVFLPPLVILRAAPLTEMMYSFFIISGIYFLYKWITANEKKFLIYCSAAFLISSSVRYEGWVFSAALILYLLFLSFIKKEVGISDMLIALFIVSVFPLFWIYNSFIQTGDPLSFVKTSPERYLITVKDPFISLLKYNLITQFLYQNIRFLLFFGFISFGYFLIQRKDIRKISTVPFIAFGILAVLSLSQIAMPSHAYWRIPLIWNVLLIPFASHSIIKLLQLISEMWNKRFNKIAVAVFLMIILYFIFQLKILTNIHGFNKDDFETGRYLKEKLEVDNNIKLLIDTSDLIYLHVIVASNNPDSFLLNEGEDPLFPEPPVLNTYEGINIEDLNNKRIKYLIFKRDDYIEVLNKNPQIVFKRNFGVWKIYKNNFR